MLDAGSDTFRLHMTSRKGKTSKASLASVYDLNKASRSFWKFADQIESMKLRGILLIDLAAGGWNGYRFKLNAELEPMTALIARWLAYFS